MLFLLSLLACEMTEERFSREFVAETCQGHEDCATLDYETRWGSDQSECRLDLSLELDERLLDQGCGLFFPDRAAECLENFGAASCVQLADGDWDYEICDVVWECRG